MTESEWLECSDPESMVGWVTTGGGPVASQYKLRCIEDAVFNRFGLNLDDLVVQDKPPVDGCDIIRDIVGNPFRPFRPAIYDNPGCPNRAVRHPQSICSCPPWLTPTVLSLAQAAHDELWDKAEEVERIEKMIDTQRFIMSRCYSDSAYRVYSSNLDRFRKELAKVEELPHGMLDPQRLKILSDALEEAGCEQEECGECPVLRKAKINSDGSYDRDMVEEVIEWGKAKKQCRCGGTGKVTHSILTHLRSPDSHYRGCWAIDLILGKE